MKNRTVIAPILESAVVELSSNDGLTFRKKILPLATIDYPMDDGSTRKVTFDRAYHADVIDSFRRGAYDSPTLQLATESNAHNMLPERTAGTIIDVSPELPTDEDGPGLYATIKALTPEHAKLLRENTALGASAQIREGYKRVDGQRFKRALRHVLATIDPRVTRLGQFRAVSLSSDDGDQVIDLSSADYEETDMGDTTATADAGTLDLTDEEIEEALAEAAGAMGGDDPDDTGDESGDTTDAGDATSEERDLSSTPDNTRLVSLAARVDNYGAETRTILAKLARAEWENERRRYSQAGVPKAFLDLASPVLASADDTTISLSNDDGDLDDVDAKAVIRAMLDAAKGIIDLSNPDGLGLDPGDTGDSHRDETQAYLDSWSARSGNA